MEKLNLKPTHKPVQNYYEALRQFFGIQVGVSINVFVSQASSRVEWAWDIADYQVF